MWDKPRIASVLKAYLFCRFDTIPASDEQVDTGPQHIVLCTGIAYASRIKNDTLTLRHDDEPCACVLYSVHLMPAAATSSHTHTHMPLIPSSISWYQPSSDNDL